MYDVVPIALTKQAGIFNALKLVANNLANSETTGFKSSNLLFSSQQVPNGESRKIDYNVEAFAFVDEGNGPIKITERVFDVALEGEGYFVVQTPLGQRYTRAGNFQLDQNGVLVDQNFNQVMAAGGQQIAFQSNDTDIMIDEAGMIHVNGKAFQPLSVVAFAHPELKEAVGNGLYDSPVKPEPARDFRVIQGALEGSNVQAVKELTKMIEIQRSSDFISNFITILHDISLNTVRTVANMAVR